MKKILLTTTLISLTTSCFAKTDWGTFSDIGADGLLISSLALPTYYQDWQGLQQAGLTLLTSGAVVWVGKYSIAAERPDKSDFDSFPSSHTANAFAAATTLSQRYGWQVGVPSYTVASLVGYARVEQNKHHWHDVLAGATIGILSGIYFTSPAGVNIAVSPWSDGDSQGLTLSYQW